VFVLLYADDPSVNVAVYLDEERKPTMRTDLFGGEKRYSKEFQAFWAQYPKKKGTSKNAAYKAWGHARRSASCEAIMEGLAIYPFNPDPQFQPHAVTWLNQARWEIEEDTVPPSQIVPEIKSTPSKGAWMEGFGSPGLFLDAEVGDD